MNTLPFTKIHQIQQVFQTIDCTDLILIMSQLNGEQYYLVYNCDDPPPVPSANIQTSSLHESLILPSDFDGPVVGYASLDIMLADLPTHGINFFSIREMMKTQMPLYHQNAYRLALTLLDYLERLPDQPSAELATRNRLKVIRLAWPTLLKGHSLSHLLAIIPTGSLRDFISLNTHGFKLFYYTPEISELQTSWQNATQDSSWFIGLVDMHQLLSAPSSRATLIDLRPLLHMMDQPKALSDTCRALAAWCWHSWQTTQESLYHEKAYTFAAEAWLIHQDVDDLVALLPAENFQHFLDTGDAIHIYRTPRIQQLSSPQPEKNTIYSLGDLVHNRVEANNYQTYPIAFPVLSTILRYTTLEKVLDLGPILWSAGRQTEIARSFWLLSRDLLRLPSPTWSVINAAPDTITSMAQRAVLIYSLQNPWLWRQGRYAQFLKQSYEHLLNCLINQGTLASSEAATQYCRLLSTWYDCAFSDDLVRNLGELSRIGQAVQNLSTQDGQTIGPDKIKIVGQLTKISDRLYQPAIDSQRTSLELHMDNTQPFEVYAFLQSIVQADAPIIPLSHPFLRWLQEYETLHNQWLALQETLGGERPSFEKLEALLASYQHLVQIVHAPAHELAVLNWAIAQDMQRINRLKEAIETGPIIKISVRNPWVNPGLRERLRIDIENLGGTPAYQFQLELITSSQFDFLSPQNTLTIDTFPPGYQRRLTWEIRAHDPTITLNFHYQYLDHHGKPHTSRDNLVVQTLSTHTDPIRPVGNLYQAGPPVSGFGRFFGRRYEIEQILSRIIGGITQPILLRGPRRMGKTSILRQLEWILQTNKEQRVMGLTAEQEIQLNACLPVFHTLQSIKDPDDTATFFQMIYEDICESLGLSYDPDQLSRQFHRSPTRAFMKQMARVFEQRPHIRPLVIIDEWDELYRPEYARLAINLRSLMEGEVRVNWVVSSTWTLSEEAGRYGSPFYNQAFTIELGEMAWQPAVELVTSPSQKMGLQWRGEAVVALLEQTGRRPYLIQLLCSKLIDYLRLKNSTIIDTEAVTAVSTQLIQEAQATAQYFGFLWKDEKGGSLDGVNWMGRLILWALDKYYPRPLTRAEIRETIETAFHQQELSIPEPAFFWQEFNSQITQLQLIFDAITLDGERYTISVPLVQRWLRQVISQQENPIQYAHNDMLSHRAAAQEPSS